MIMQENHQSDPMQTKPEASKVESIKMAIKVMADDKSPW